MTDKDRVRSAWQSKLTGNTAALPWGKAAEKLRGMQVYRAADTVFATPEESLYQARINCLVDGKNLVMPGPSMRAGFFLLAAHSIPYKDISAAVTYKGLDKYGLLLKHDAIQGLAIGLLLTDSLAVDHDGGRLGPGNGFFDLGCALLHELQALQQDWTALTFIQENQISRRPLPQDTWDIRVCGAVTPSGIITFAPPPQKPQISWKMLAEDRIRRIDPLWKLYANARREVDE